MWPELVDDACDTVRIDRRHEREVVRSEQCADARSVAHEDFVDER